MTEKHMSRLPGKTKVLIAGVDTLILNAKQKGDDNTPKKTQILPPDVGEHLDIWQKEAKFKEEPYVTPWKHEDVFLKMWPMGAPGRTWLLKNGCVDLIGAQLNKSTLARVRFSSEYLWKRGVHVALKNTHAFLNDLFGFPREFGAGSGRGQIETPSGELVEGRHQAAWPYDLWQRMIEVKSSQYRRPTKEAQKRPHEFSRIIVCAGCRRPLCVKRGGILPYYVDTSLERKLPCPVSGNLSVRSSLVVVQFGEILRSFELPMSWREAIAERCQSVDNDRDEIKRIRRHRTDLEAEQKRLVSVFMKGYITEQDFDEQGERIRAELFSLPVPTMQDAEKMTQAALSAGETLEKVADYWSEAMPEERRDMVWSLLKAEGLIYDLERHVIVGLKPRAGVLPTLALGLEATLMWEQREDVLWLREDYWPAKREVVSSGGRPSSLTKAEQERAIMLIRQGMPLEKIAELFTTSYDTIRRFANSQGIILHRSERKLSSEQLSEAYDLLRADVPFREVARKYEVHPESLRRLAIKDSVKLRAKREKRTPTQRKLTVDQLQEIHELIEGGMSVRQVAKQTGISRGALVGLLKK